MDSPVLVALIAAAALIIGGIVSPLVAGWFSRKSHPTQTAQDRRVNAETDSLVAINLTNEIKRLDAELAEARANFTLLRTEVRKLQADVERRPTRDELLDANGKLRKQLIDLGEVPKNGEST